MQNTGFTRLFQKPHLSLWAYENKKELSTVPQKLNINFAAHKTTINIPSSNAAPCYLGLGNTQRSSLCFPFYDLNLTESREKEENVPLFSGPSLCLHVLSCKMRITIITIRKYLFPRDMGKVREIMGPAASRRGGRGAGSPTPP